MSRFVVTASNADGVAVATTFWDEADAERYAYSILGASLVGGTVCTTHVYRATPTGMDLLNEFEF